MKFHLSQKKEKLATAHFREARAAYFAWGAYAKTKQLEQRYSILTLLISRRLIRCRYAPLAGQLNKSISTSMYTSASGFLPPAAEPQIGNIDLNSVLKACQILSSEMDFTKLLHNMIRIVIQNTGAQRGRIRLSIRMFFSFFFAKVFSLYRTRMANYLWRCRGIRLVTATLRTLI